MGEIAVGSGDVTNGPPATGATAAAAPTPPTPPTEPEIGRPKERRERHRPNTKVLKNAPHQMTNCVILCRRLPPTMTEETFMEQVAPVPEYDYFYFAKPDSTLAPNLFSRAYINFINEEDIYIFRDKFDDYIFLDDKGNEYPAIVEYAPFQRVLKKRRKKDIKCGTLESDPIYMEFMESFNDAENEVREPKMEYSYQPAEDKKEEAVNTPLLDFLASRKRDEKKRREEKQRRRPRNRMHRDDDNYDDGKHTRSKDDEKSFADDKDDDDSPGNDDSLVEVKESHFQNKGRIKSYKDQKRSDENRKKNDYSKKERYTPKEFDGDCDDGNDDKSTRKDKRDRHRDSYRDKYKEKEKFYEMKKDKYKDKKYNKPWLHKDTDEKETEKSSNPNEAKPSASTTTSGNEKPSKTPLSSSNIKPFTQLPQFKISDISKVIDEMDASRQKTTEKSDDNSKTEKSTDNKPNKIVIKRKEDKSEPVLKSVKNIPENDNKEGEKIEKQRRNSLETKQKDSNDEVVLRRNKSLDDKSQDSSTGDEKSKPDKSRDNGIDPRSERRIRNKDRPSIVIYQPGMGKFSKQRIDREKDTPCKTSESNKMGNSSNGSEWNSGNSQPDTTADD